MLITHDANQTWRYGQVETALCLWEAMLDYRDPHAMVDPAMRDKVDHMFGDNGSFTMRAAVASLADDCDEAWEAREALDGDDHIAFDFEFCPNFLAGAINSGLLETAISWQYKSVAQLQHERATAA
jgi:hypothetical protein